MTTDAHPETQVLIGGQEADPAGFDFDLYRKTKPAEAVQLDVPFQVKTLEGTFDAKAGDYLMRGPAGELYSCDKTIFENTYDDYSLVGGTSVTNNVTNNEGDEGDEGFSSEELMWVLWVVVALAVIVSVTMLIWHTVDRHTEGFVQKQRTAQQISKEWEAANNACANDEQPRICIERAHGNGATTQ